MAKIVAGVAMIVGGIALMIFVPGAGAMIGSKLLLMGISMTISGIADQMHGGPGTGFTTRQPTAPRQIVYGEARVAGSILYQSVTGHQLNQVIAWASHPIHSIESIYLDAREVMGCPANGGGVSGGYCNATDNYDPSGTKYNLKGRVFMQSTLGSYEGQWLSALWGQNNNYWGPDCTLNGIAATYIKCTYDADVFPSGAPNARATITGKCDLWDPRLGEKFLADGVTVNPASHGYTNNAALCIADVLMNNEFGIGCTVSEIDKVQLIAAANVCDELVHLANGGYEPRYTVNGFLDTSGTPGDLIDSMLMACEGRITYNGGQWKIFPAAWYGTTLNFDQDDLAGDVKWMPRRKMRDLTNTVRATYICPVYPFGQFGYNRDHRDENVWSGEWQPVDAPEYAQDAAHGYANDLNLAADDNVKLYSQRKYQFVTSVGQVQRCMKIFLMRNRQQGTGTLQMKLGAYQTQAQDVVKMSFPALQWANKWLEVVNFHFVPKFSKSEDDAPTILCELDVQESDPSCYTWSTQEERGVQDTPSPTLGNPYDVGQITNLALESGLDSAIVQPDGVIIPRIHVTWTEPDDPFVTTGGSIVVEYQEDTEGDTWHPVGTFGGTTVECYVTGITVKHHYYVRVKCVRANGQASDWVKSGDHTVSITKSTITQVGTLLGPTAVMNVSGTLYPTIYQVLIPGGMVVPGQSTIRLRSALQSYGQGVVDIGVALQPVNTDTVTIAPGVTATINGEQELVMLPMFNSGGTNGSNAMLTMDLQLASSQLTTKYSITNTDWTYDAVGVSGTYNATPRVQTTQATNDVTCSVTEGSGDDGSTDYELCVIAYFPDGTHTGPSNTVRAGCSHFMLNWSAVPGVAFYEVYCTKSVQGHAGALTVTVGKVHGIADPSVNNGNNSATEWGGGPSYPPSCTSLWMDDGGWYQFRGDGTTPPANNTAGSAYNTGSNQMPVIVAPCGPVDWSVDQYLSIWAWTDDGTTDQVQGISLSSEIMNAGVQSVSGQSIGSGGFVGTSPSGGIHGMAQYNTIRFAA